MILPQTRLLREHARTKCGIVRGLRGRTLEGHLYREGNGVSQDYKEAVRWYRLAAEQGDASKLTTGFSSSTVALQP